MAQVSTAWAQAAPATPAPPAASKPEAQSDNEIVVVGQGAERGSIDRTTYLVRDNAEARSANTLEILRRIPSVDVTPDGQIRLLGTAGVKILIDGKEVADAEAMLRSMQGSQIAKVEVISNPSAQFSAQGTAGIINIVTRRSFAAGVRGSATASGGSFGAGELKLAPTWSNGPWSLSGSVDLDHYGTPLGFARDRISLDPQGAILAETVENGITRNRFDDASGNLVVSYKPGPKQAVTFSAEGYGYRGHSPQQSTITTLGDPSATQSRTSAGTFTGRDQDLALDYRGDGAREGETLTASAKYSSFDNQNDDNFTTDPGSGAPTSFQIRSDNSTSVATLKLDYIRPFDARRRLSFGGTIEDTSSTQVQRQGGSLPAGDPLPQSDSTIGGAWTDKAAYFTYQFPLAGGTVLAGLRFEDRAYRFGADSPIGALDRNDFFPSLHVERKLAKWLTGHLSYSRRVAWPGIVNLNPALRFSDPATATAGNPALRPEITDAYEGKLSLGISSHKLDLTLFIRRTKDPISQTSVLNADGVLLTGQVNLGSVVSRGASLSARGPIGGGFRYSLNADAADRKFTLGAIIADAAAAADAQYGGSAQIEYRDGTEGRRGADHVTLDLRYRGPTNVVLYRASSFFTATTSWSHGFTDRLSGVLKIDDLAGARHYVTTYFSADSVSRQTYRTPGRRITLSLIRSLGRAPQRTP